MFTHCYCAPVYTHGGIVDYTYSVFNDTGETIRSVILVRERSGVVLAQSHAQELSPGETLFYDLNNVRNIQNAIVEVIIAYPEERRPAYFSLDIPQDARSINVTDVITRGLREPLGFLFP